jgi:hypothetical protein
MKLSAQNRDRGTLRDANGLEIRAAVEADTVTGEVTEFVLDADGKKQIGDDGPILITTRYAAPLTFIRRSEI